MTSRRGRQSGRQVSSARYPRVARVNELLREVIAEELEQLTDDDERLGLLTVTAVTVDADLRHGTVLLSSLSDEVKAALEEHRVRIQGAIGRQVRMRRTPLLTFAADPAIQVGQRVEEIIKSIRAADEMGESAGEAGIGEGAADGPQG